MANQEVDNVPENKIGLFYISFHLLFILLLFSVIFLLFFSQRTLPPAIKELIAFSCIIIIPLLLPKFNLVYRIIIVFLLFFFFNHLEYLIANHPNLELGAIGYIIMSFILPPLIITACHYLFKCIRRIDDHILKIIIIIEILLILLIAFQSYSNIKSQIKEFDNRNILSEIKCKGAYTTTTPEELKLSCDKIITSGRFVSDWSSTKDYCYEVVEKIRTDPYYFDDQLASSGQVPDMMRSLSNTVYCSAEKYNILKPLPQYPSYSSSEFTKVTPAVVEDPRLCEHLNKSSGAQDNCYHDLAFYMKDLSYCDKTRFPTQCYNSVYRETNGTANCNNTLDQDKKLLCLSVLKDDTSYCNGLSTDQLKVECYAQRGGTSCIGLKEVAPNLIEQCDTRSYEIWNYGDGGLL